MRIFLAEDEQDLNAIIVQKLTEDGYSVDHCFDGRTAIDILSCTEYDAVILDIMMPKADGFTVLRALRGMGKTTRVLFLTAKDAVSDRVKGLDSGANDYLVKPFSFEELSARLRAMMRGSFGVTDNVLHIADLSLDCTSHRCLAHKNRLPAFSLRMHGHTSVGTSRYRWQDPKVCPTHRRRSPMGSLNDA